MGCHIPSGPSFLILLQLNSQYFHSQNYDDKTSWLRVKGDLQSSFDFFRISEVTKFVMTT